jgi:hypothetical protein
MNALFDDVCYASLPATALPILGDLRRSPDVKAIVIGDRAWVCWEPANSEVFRRLFPIPRVNLYVRRDGSWYLHGSRLPAPEVPDAASAKPLYDILFPEAVQATRPDSIEPTPHMLRLVRSCQPRHTRGMSCNLADISQWVNRATGKELSAIRAARTRDRVMLLGTNLPALPAAQRFWGQRLLLPLGHDITLSLSEDALLQALGVAENELLVLSAGEADVISLKAFEPLTRAGVRLALREPL